MFSIGYEGTCAGDIIRRFLCTLNTDLVRLNTCHDSAACSPRFVPTLISILRRLGTCFCCQRIQEGVNLFDAILEAVSDGHSLCGYIRIMYMKD